LIIAESISLVNRKMKLYFAVKDDAVFSILRRFGLHMKEKYTKNEEDAVDFL
jgi:hypothetical protein